MEMESDEREDTTLGGGFTGSRGLLGEEDILST